MDPRPAPKPLAVTLRCPPCGGTVTIRAPGQSVTVICEHCHASLDVSDGVVGDVVKYAKQSVYTTIPLGKRGTIRNQLFEVIGMMTKFEDSYTWDEYLLFNPKIGFRWLVNDHGHWNFVTPVSVPPVGAELAFSVSELHGNDNARYRVYHKGTATVRRVLGEFYWRVRQGEKTRTCDFIAPPFMLSAERSEQEITWSKLEYLEPNEVAAAFAISPPRRTGIAPNQPNPDAAHSRTIRNIGVAAIVLALLMQIAHSVGTPKRLLASENIDVRKAVAEDPIEIGPFQLKGGKSTVEVASSASVDNQWVDIGLLLENDETGAAYEFNQVLERYSGYDSDGSWTEGSGRESSMLGSVPPGTCHLVADVSTSAGLPYRPYDGLVHLEVVQGSQSWSAFLFVLIALALYPAYCMWRLHRFEVQRWSNSESSPYASSDDDDDDSDFDSSDD